MAAMAQLHLEVIGKKSYRIIIICTLISYYRRCGSVVRTSVFSWWTFPDLCLIYGWHVTTSWVRCLPWVNQPGQLSLPSLWGG